MSKKFNNIGISGLALATAITFGAVLLTGCAKAEDKAASTSESTPESTPTRTNVMWDSLSTPRTSESIDKFMEAKDCAGLEKERQIALEGGGFGWKEHGIAYSVVEYVEEALEIAGCGVPPYRTAVDWSKFPGGLKAKDTIDKLAEAKDCVGLGKQWRLVRDGSTKYDVIGHPLNYINEASYKIAGCEE